MQVFFLLFPGGGPFRPSPGTSEEPKQWRKSGFWVRRVTRESNSPWPSNIIRRRRSPSSRARRTPDINCLPFFRVSPDAARSSPSTSAPRPIAPPRRSMPSSPACPIALPPRPASRSSTEAPRSSTSRPTSACTIPTCTPSGTGSTILARSASRMRCTAFPSCTVPGCTAHVSWRTPDAIPRRCCFPCFRSRAPRRWVPASSWPTPNRASPDRDARRLWAIRSAK